MTHTSTEQERQAPIKMHPGDDLHLTVLMASHGLNFVTGKDREQLLAWGRDVWQAASGRLVLGSEPVAYLWQHTITGQTKALMHGDVFTAGPHWRLVGPLFLATERVQAVPKQAATQPANL